MSGAPRRVVVFGTESTRPWIGFLYFGFGVIVVEIFSRVRFMMQMKTTHLLILLVLFGAGVGLVLRSFRDEKLAAESDKEDKAEG